MGWGSIRSLVPRTGWIAGEAVNYNNLGLVCFDLGRLNEAAEHHHAALALACKGNAFASQALALTNLGQVHRLLGRSDEAFHALTDALRLHEQTGSRGRAVTLCALARIHSDRGDRPQATKLVQEALGMAREPAEPRLEAIALHTLGIIDRDTRILLEALTGARKADDRYIEADIILSIAELDEPAVLSWCYAALSIAEPCGYQVLQGRALTARAAAEYDAGDIASALHSARSAWQLHATTGHKRIPARAGSRTARVVRQKGDLGPVVEVQFGEYRRHMLFHRRHAHKQPGSDLSVGTAPADRLGNVAFAFAEPGEHGAGVLPAFARTGLSNVGDQLAGYRWGEDRLTGRHPCHRSKDLGGRGVLEQEATRPGP